MSGIEKTEGDRVSIQPIAASSFWLARRNECNIDFLAPV